MTLASKSSMSETDKQELSTVIWHKYGKKVFSWEKMSDDPYMFAACIEKQELPLCLHMMPSTKGIRKHTGLFFTQNQPTVKQPENIQRGF